MVMESDIQFEDIFYSQQLQPMSYKPDIDFQLDMILGLTPLPFDLSEQPIVQKIGEVENLARKNSLKSESQDTHLSSCEEQSRVTEHSSDSKTSNHHNFQKHTVTALKDIVKENQFQNYCSDASKLRMVTILWRQFLKIKGKSIMTKKFLSILFKNDMKSVQQLKPYGFKEMFQKFNQADILTAKIELKRLVIIFLSDNKVEDHVEKRQIKRKEQFRLYLINFRRDLQSSNVKKRISKESSDWISENARIFDCLN